MNIHEEFVRLSTLATTPEGWDQIEAPFLSHDNLLGFALILNTWQYEIGKCGDPHIQAKSDLLSRLLNEMTAPEYEIAEKLLIQGRMVKLEGFAFPLLMFLCLDKKSLEIVEPWVLKLEIALPVSLLFLRYNEGLREHIAASTAL